MIVLSGSMLFVVMIYSLATDIFALVLTGGVLGQSSYWQTELLNTPAMTSFELLPLLFALPLFLLHIAIASQHLRGWVG